MQGKLHVDVGMWGGLTPQNSGDPEQLQGLLDAGALGLKCFLSPSGVLHTRIFALRMWQALRPHPWCPCACKRPAKTLVCSIFSMQQFAPQGGPAMALTSGNGVHIR